MQYVELNVVQNSVCANAYSIVDIGATQMCVGGQKGKDSCKGDSGSGLMRETASAERSNKFWRLIGVVSYGPDKMCGIEGRPGVYTKVRSYLDWILENVETK